MKIIKADISNYSNRKDGKIQYIIVHYTGNNGDTAENNCKYFQNPNRGASAHYFVDEREVCQSVEERYKAWHCGSENGSYSHNLARNENTIGVEMCSIKKGDVYYFLENTVINTATLVKTLMKKYNIPPENILRHYDVTGKKCPAPYIDRIMWSKFKGMLADYSSVEKKEFFINGTKKVIDTIFENNTNYVNVRELSNALDSTVAYDNDSKKITINKNLAYKEETTTKIKINGQLKNIKRVLVGGENFIRLRDLDSKFIKVAYVAKEKLVTVETQK